MGKKNKRNKVKFPKKNVITYDKYKPNRKARRLGVKAEVPQKEEKKEPTAVILKRKIQQVKEIEKRIVPQGMSYGEYIEHLRAERLKEMQDKVKNTYGSI